MTVLRTNGSSGVITVNYTTVPGTALPGIKYATTNGVLSFANGANVSLSHSWDVWKHSRLPLEIYGSEGSMLAPDPNFFGGEPKVTQRDGDSTSLDIGAHPYCVPNRVTRTGAHVADHRIIGLLDMAAAIRSNPEWMQKACESMSSRLGEMYLGLAETWLQKDQPQQAMLCLERVIRTFPGTRQAEVAQYRMVQLQGQTTQQRSGYQNPTAPKQ